MLADPEIPANARVTIIARKVVAEAETIVKMRLSKSDPLMSQRRPKSSDAVDARAGPTAKPIAYRLIPSSDTVVLTWNLACTP